jgi:peptidoglycan-binding protein ArfA
VRLATRFGQTAPGSTRRSLSLPWLIGLVVIPLLIAAIGHAAFERPRSTNGASGALPTVAPSSKSGAPKLSLAPLSITRNGNNITLNGDFPDDSAKAALVKALKGSLPANVDIVDQIRINPDVDALDFAHAGPVFADSASITDFNLTVNRDTIILAGTAASQGQQNTVGTEAKRIWSNLNVVDNLAINGPVPPPAPPASPAAGSCTDLQSAINPATGGPITFEINGFTLTPAEEQSLTQVADKLKACPSAHATINGYTDNSGTESINGPLGHQRAQTVENFLAAHGVAGDHLAVKGLGTANPVAANDTADGRAKNRRVEIVVS